MCKALIRGALLTNFKQASSNCVERAELKDRKRLSAIKEGENDENSQVEASNESNPLKAEASNESKVLKAKANDENNSLQAEADDGARPSNLSIGGDSSTKRHAIIFHCEFSSQRAPSM